MHKSEKICFSKSVGILSLVLFVAILFTLAAAYLPQKSTSTNSRASAPQQISCGGDWQTPCPGSNSSKYGCSGGFVYQKTKDAQPLCIPIDSFKNSYSLRDNDTEKSKAAGKFVVGSEGYPCYPNKNLKNVKVNDGGGTCNPGMRCIDFTSEDVEIHSKLLKEGDIFQPLLSNLPSPDYKLAFPHLLPDFKQDLFGQYRGGICVPEQKQCGGENQTPCPVSYGDGKDCTFPNSQMAYINGYVLSTPPGETDVPPIKPGKYLGCVKSTYTTDLEVELVQSTTATSQLLKSQPIMKGENEFFPKETEFPSPPYSLYLNLTNNYHSVDNLAYKWKIVCFETSNPEDKSILEYGGPGLRNLSNINFCPSKHGSVFTVIITSEYSRYNTSNYKDDALNMVKPSVTSKPVYFQFNLQLN